MCGEGWANEVCVGAILELDEVGFDSGIATFDNFLGKPRMSHKAESMPDMAL